MSYNLTNVTDANNIYEVVKAVNSTSNGLFFGILLLILFFIIIVVFQQNSFKTRLLASGFICTIVAVFGFFLGFISWGILIVPILVLFASVLMLLFVED